MNSQYDLEDMEDYLAARMSESDREAFEQALQSDNDLVRRLHALEAEARVNRLLQEEFLLEQFQQWDLETETAERVRQKPKPGRKWLLLPGIVALLIGILGAGAYLGWFSLSDKQPGEKEHQPEIKEIKKDTTPNIHLQNPNLIATKPLDNQADEVENGVYASLAEGAYIKEDFNLTLMGAGNEESNTGKYSRAVVLYTAGKYAEALELLEKPQPKQMEEFLYLRGYTYYHLKRYNRAEQDFKAFRKFPVSDRKMDAQWCEVFCMLKQLPSSRNRLDTLLQEIKSNPDNTYFERADALQKALEKK